MDVSADDHQQISDKNLTTEAFTVDKPGTYHFRQRVTYNDTVISEDECGAATEIVTVSQPPRAPLAATGTNPLPLWLAGILVSVVGFTAIMIGRTSVKKRSHKA